MAADEREHGLHLVGPLAPRSGLVPAVVGEVLVLLAELDEARDVELDLADRARRDRDAAGHRSHGHRSRSNRSRLPSFFTTMYGISSILS